MDLPINLKKTRNKLYIFLAVAGVVLYSLYCFLILPLYFDMGVKADIGLVQPIVPELIDFLGKTVEILAIAVFCAVIVYGVHSFGVSCFKGGFFIFAGLCGYKHLSNVIFEWISSRYIPLDFWADILLALLNVIVELLPFAAAMLLIMVIIKKRGLKPQINEIGERESKSFGQLFNPKDFSVAATMIFSATVLFTKLCGKIANDALLILATGFPTDSKTYLLMLANYSLSILFAVLCYFVMLLVISFLGDRFKSSSTQDE